MPLVRVFLIRRLRHAAVWLMAHLPESILKLTKKDWQDIIKSQGIAADYVAWAFRESDGTKKCQKRIPALCGVWMEGR